MGIKEVVVPLTASVHGAVGLASSDVIYEYGRSDHLFIPADIRRIRDNFSGLVERAVQSLRAAGFKADEMKIIRSLDMRYRHQVHELNVPLKAGTSAPTEQEMEEAYGHFDELYEQTYGPGAGYREAGKEIMAFRVLAIGAEHGDNRVSFASAGGPFPPARGQVLERSGRLAHCHSFDVADIARRVLQRIDRHRRSQPGARARQGAFGPESGPD